MEELQQEQANGLLHKRKLILRLDDGSLIGPVETLLPGTGGHGGPSAVLLDFEAACRTGRAGQKELDRLDRLIRDFQTRVSGLHSIAPKDLKQRNPYTNDVSDRIMCSTPALRFSQCLFKGLFCTDIVEFSGLDIVPQSCQQQHQLQQQQQTHSTWGQLTQFDLLTCLFLAFLHIMWWCPGSPDAQQTAAGYISIYCYHPLLFLPMG
jgi:hypothetical protein